jgi:mannan endo-1,4-beta-mannosidase
MKRLFAFLFLAILSLAVSAQPAGISPPPTFTVKGSTLLDPTGNAFVIRGVNRLHWDNGAAPGIVLSGANAERVAIDFTQTAEKNRAVIAPITAAGIVPIPGNWTTTCKDDPASLSGAVDTWVAQVATWVPVLNSGGIVDVANEWGPSNYTQQQVAPWAKLPNYGWRDGYVAAVPRLRTAGYRGAIMVDAPACGQDWLAVVRDGAAIEAADPLHNVVFDVHVYGALSTPALLMSAFGSLAASGLPIVIGEFGPGRNIGPSPTPIDPVQIIGLAELAGFGWLAWAWDDNNLPACAANDAWFSMTTKCGAYATIADLTSFGRVIVPILQATAKKAQH